MFEKKLQLIQQQLQQYLELIKLEYFLQRWQWWRKNSFCSGGSGKAKKVFAAMAVVAQKKLVVAGTPLVRKNTKKIRKIKCSYARMYHSGNFRKIRCRPPKKDISAKRTHARARGKRRCCCYPCSMYQPGWSLGILLDRFVSYVAGRLSLIHI